jgi:hypothetical protein
LLRVNHDGTTFVHCRRGVDARATVSALALARCEESDMHLYFMHLRDSTDELLDPDGLLLPDDAVAGAALTAARDCMAHDLRSGRLDLRYRIEVEDEAGEIVHTLHFAEAFEMVTA